VNEEIPEPKIIPKVLSDDLQTEVSYSTQYDARDPELPDALRNFFSSLSQPDSVWAELQNTHNKAVENLVHYGFDAQVGRFFAFPREHQAPHFSREWYAAQIANESFLVLSRPDREAGPRSDFDVFDVRKIFNLGKRIGELNFRIDQESNARRGVKIRKSASNGGRAKALEAAGAKYAVLARMAELIANGKSARSAATIVAREKGKTTAGILSVWNRAKSDL
jgi:hypothetical protein